MFQISYEKIHSGAFVLIVKLTTNMKQFSHLTFHRLDVLRKYEDFLDLYKKVSGLSNYANILPKFPKKKGKENVQPFTEVFHNFIFRIHFLLS